MGSSRYTYLYKTSQKVKTKTCMFKKIIEIRNKEKKELKNPSPKSSGILGTSQGAAYLKTTYHIVAVQNPPSSPLPATAPTTVTTTAAPPHGRRRIF